MEQELLFGEASSKILPLLHARVKQVTFLGVAFGYSGKLMRTSVHVSTLWLRIWSKGRFLAHVAFDCSCATTEPLSCGILLAASPSPAE